ncbi:MAG TPA: helix-turn-helix domain-containing protein [Burkholderiaceae bacterium]|nr:helix-turn-helix domain-containing protein [Burkholderiaceae bacterium]
MSSVIDFGPAIIQVEGASLPAQRLADSRDVDEAREQTGRMFGGARLRRLSRHGTFHCVLDHVPLGPVSFNRFRWGAQIELEPLACTLPGYFLVSLPTDGGAEVWQDGEAQALAVGSPGVFSPIRSFELKAQEGYDQLLVRIDAQFLARAWLGISGAPLTGPLYFEMAIPDRPLISQGWSALIAQAAITAVLPMGGKAREFAQAALADNMATLLLTQHAHNHRFWLDAPTSVVGHAQRLTKQAEEFLLRRLRAPVSITDICIACGVSRRTLFAAFQSHRKMGPMAWLRHQRLDAARVALERPVRENTRVADIAMEFCFANVGDFAGAYRQHCGEPPSQTLRRGFAYRSSVRSGPAGAAC